MSLMNVIRFIGIPCFGFLEENDNRVHVILLNFFLKLAFLALSSSPFKINSPGCIIVILLAKVFLLAGLQAKL